MFYRATNGNTTIERTTEVIAFKQGDFVRDKTGVLKNTSESVVISCKASGEPRPELDLLLYDEYGQSLETHGFKVQRL